MNATAGYGGSVTLSVVISTRDRPHLLERCLEALASQVRKPDEVVVVDDCSRTPVESLVRAAAGDLPVKVMRVKGGSVGPPVARNRGWRATSAKFVAFTDDDCRPSPEWALNLLQNADENSVIVGRTIPDPTAGPALSALDRSMEVEGEDGRFSTCNICYPRKLLEATGGFDPAFGHSFGEDTDLGQRALALGAGAKFSRGALVYHAIHPGSLRRALRESRRMETVPELIRRYPHLRHSVICDGFFARQSHRQMVRTALGAAVGLAGVVAARRAARSGRAEAWLASVLLLSELQLGVNGIQDWWITARPRIPEGARQGIPLWRDTASLALLDAAEIAICAVASWRTRTLVL
jgi:GT2 family glycosyltransferase